MKRANEVVTDRWPKLRCSIFGQLMKNGEINIVDLI